MWWKIVRHLGGRLSGRVSELIELPVLMHLSRRWRLEVCSKQKLHGFVLQVPISSAVVTILSRLINEDNKNH